MPPPRGVNSSSMSEVFRLSVGTFSWISSSGDAASSVSGTASGAISTAGSAAICVVLGVGDDCGVGSEIAEAARL